MRKWSFIFVLIFCCIFLHGAIAIAETENSMVKRDELANVVMESYEYITQEFLIPTLEQPVFSDINNSQFKFRIGQAYINGFVNGVGDGKFSPDEPVSKSQVATVLYRFINCLNMKYDVVLTEKQINICDYSDIPEWSREAVSYMISTDLMSLSEGNFHPNDLMDRNELNEIIERINRLFVISDDEIERIDFQTFLERKNAIK